jgi:hypothetical protein
VTTESFEEDLLGAALPVTASGEVTSTDLDGSLVSEGRSFSEIEDPTMLQQPNPEELRLEAACYSNAPNIEYVVQADAVELREIVFTRSGNPLADPEIDFGLFGNQTVESTVFLSGAIVVWTTAPDAGVNDVEGAVSIVITHDEADVVFDTSITLTLNEGGDLTFASSGPIVTAPLTVDDLAEDSLVDDATLAALRQIERAGTLLMLAIPDQSHRYSYDVRADVPLELAAQMTIELRTPPGGVGVAAALGRPFEHLADYVTRSLPDVDGLAVQRAVNAAVAAAGPVTGTAPSFCGLFGTEGWTLALLPLGLWSTSRWRRYTRR